MKQRINLLNYLRIERKYKLTPKTVLYLYGLFLMLLILNLLFSVKDLHQQTRNKNFLAAELKSEQDKLVTFTKEYPIINPKDLQGTVQELQKQLNQRVKLTGLLSQNGFTPIFKKLSQAILPTVWLSEILINNNDRVILLRGFSFEALPIQLFLDNLNHLKAFDDELINLQNVTKIRNKNNFLFLSFEVSNKTGLPT